MARTRSRTSPSAPRRQRPQHALRHGQDGARSRHLARLPGPCHRHAVHDGRRRGRAPGRPDRDTAGRERLHRSRGGAHTSPRGQDRHGRFPGARAQWERDDRHRRQRRRRAEDRRLRGRSCRQRRQLRLQQQCRLCSGGPAGVGRCNRRVGAPGRHPDGAASARHADRHHRGRRLPVHRPAAAEQRRHPQHRRPAADPLRHAARTSPAGRPWPPRPPGWPS